MNFLGIDYGTTSVKAALFDEKLNQLAVFTEDYTLKTKDNIVEFEAEKRMIEKSATKEELEDFIHQYFLELRDIINTKREHLKLRGEIKSIVEDTTIDLFHDTEHNRY